MIYEEKEGDWKRIKAILVIAKEDLTDEMKEKQKTWTDISKTFLAFMKALSLCKIFALNFLRRQPIFITSDFLKTINY